MSDITVAKLQDVLNDIERNAYEGILGSEEVTRAYVLAGELGENIEKLKAENDQLRGLCADMSRELAIKFAEETGDLPDESWEWYDRMCSLGIEVPA